MKTIYCSGCNIKVAMIADGSKLKKGMVCLCENCEKKRVASDWAGKTKDTSGVDFINDLFRNGFNG